MSSGTSILQFPSLKKTRRYGPKVRTGCRTCKVRRVKCDERKPECTRCTSTGRKCDGYAQEKDSSSQALTSQSSNLQTTPFSTLSDLGDSVLYLEFFYHCAGPTLAGNFDREFWSRTVLQMARSEPAVRHAVVALGYLTKTETGSLKHARSASAANNRKTLLLHYNKAVRCLVDRISQSSYSVEVGLVACFLFICIDFLRANYIAALTHLHSGLKILHSFGHQQKTIDHGDQQPLSILQSSSLSPSSSLAITKKVLVPMFIRATLTGLLFGAPFEPLLEGFCPIPRPVQSRAFANIQDARHAIYDLRNSTVLTVAAIGRKLFWAMQPSEEELQNHAYLLGCHESWLGALRLLEREGNLSSEDKIIASLLKISYYATYAALAGALDKEQMLYDDLLPNFKALNRHAKIVLDSMDLPTSPKSADLTTFSGSPTESATSKPSTPPSNGSKRAAAHFTFDISLIAPLYLAACHCRCPTTRRESVSLLARTPPREAIWDAEVHTPVARRVIEIEESELDPKTGWPVQRTRLASALVHGDMDENGGFWVSFTTASWILQGKNARDPKYRRPDQYMLKPDSEWDEWFVI